MLGLPALTKAAPEDTDPDVRTEAVLALGFVGKAGVPGLLTALKDKDGDVRFQTVATIAKLGADAKAAVKPLTEALEANDKSAWRPHAGGANPGQVRRRREGVTAGAEDGGEEGLQRPRQGERRRLRSKDIERKLKKDQTKDK